MITIFTRKELLITFDVKHQNHIRDILSANGIKYAVKVTNRQNAAILGSSRARTGSFGVNTDMSYEYKIYVHKKDYDQAMSLIKEIPICRADAKAHFYTPFSVPCEHPLPLPLGEVAEHSEGGEGKP